MHKAVKAAVGEVAVCLVLIVVCVIVYRDAARLPAGRYDPLGGGMLPMIVSAGIIILALVAIAMSVVKALRLAHRESAVPSPPLPRPRLGLAAGVFLAMAGLTLSIWARVPFALSSVLFVFVCFLLITRFERAMLLPGIALSVITGLGITFVFAKVFQVDLP